MGASPRILVVDDSEDLRDFYRFVLEDAGYTVIVAAEGGEALKLALEIRPDLVITDISMPGMDGLELLDRLRSDMAPPLPPIIVCSGFDMTADEALRRGASRFVPKPLDTTEMTALVALTLDGRAAGAAALAAQRQRVDAARAQTAAAAERFLSLIDTPALARRGDRIVKWVAGYFGVGSAGIGLAGPNGLQVIAASEGAPISTGMIFDGDALYSSGVMATGASLLLPDTRMFPFSDRRASGLGIRFFVAVPLLADSVPIGVLCLFDNEPRAFDSEDLQVLEHIGRTSPVIAQTHPERVQLFTLALFERLVAAETSRVHRRGGGLDLLMIDLESDGGRDALEVCDAVFETVPMHRFAICRRDRDQIALFKHAATPADASRGAAEALAAVQAHAGVRAVGWVSLVDDGLPHMPPQELTQLARGALDQAAAGPPGTIERVVFRREPWPGLRALH